MLLSDKSANDKRDSATRAKLVAAEIARLKRVQAPHRGADVALKPAKGASAAQQLEGPP